jgi:Asp-tRNA(Asn)/Glu-tRNA(Gln) amidotransferase A subunit family amidase
MERVAALVEKLTNQLAEKADKSQLKQTAVQLLAALSETDQFNNLPNNVSVMIPGGEEVVAEELAEVVEVRIPNTELQEKLALDPIKDLKAAIGINDKFQFTATLFNGDEKAFDIAVKTINGFKIYAEAQFWIKSNLREQNKWDETAEVVKAFDLLVQRRFA